MRKIAATYIFPVNGLPLKNGIIVCRNDGTIAKTIDTGGSLKEEHGLEYYSGILVPGFVNAHCHLELSHLKGKIPEKTGLEGFLGEINRLRNQEDENTETAIKQADFQMGNSGTVAVGDISNSILSVETKRTSKIYYHTFAEAFGFHPSRAERAFDFACFVESMFRENGLQASVVPHSAYSVSAPLFKKISQKAKTEKSILSIHNQESLSETRFFTDGTGPIANHLQNNLGLDLSHWKPAGINSLGFILQFLPRENPLLLVHNTFTTKTDIAELKKQRSAENTFLVLCPNSNRYIENQLPPVPLFQKEKLHLCLGTDSLASNHQLSVLAEMITLQQHFPEIELEELVKWATLNGAKALGVDDRYGSFDPGKKPGINLVTGIDWKNLKLTEQSKVKRLV